MYRNSICNLSRARVHNIQKIKLKHKRSTMIQEIFEQFTANLSSDYILKFQIKVSG